MKETSDIEEVASDHPRAGCSPCCNRKDQTDSPPMLPSKPLLYSGDLMEPSQGTLSSSKTGFLVSFLVDARGGGVTGHRHWGMRVVIPPAAVQQPTRIKCRYQQLSSLPFPPPFREREGLASRVIEISPSGEVFRSPVLIEIPHFSSNAGAERETVVLISEDGESWSEHVSDTVTKREIYQDVNTSKVMRNSENLKRVFDNLEVCPGRVIHILTSRFPKYFAIVTRVKEEVCSMGPKGGQLIFNPDSRLRVTFPKNAVHKKIKVAMHVQSVPHKIVQAAFSWSVKVSQIVAVEPRRRKFHQPIFVSIPLPCPASKLSTDSLSLRLICSITSNMEEAAWVDLTGSTPLELSEDVVHFSTKVSGIFWLLVIFDHPRDTTSSLTKANTLYKEASLVPYIARFSVFYQENFPQAGVSTLLVYCMTDDKAEKVIQSLQNFQPLAISGDVEISNGCEIAVKLNGNVVKMKQDTFTGEIETSTIRSNDIKEPFVFWAFEKISLTLLVQPKDPGQPLTGSLSFFRRLTGISVTQLISLCKLDFDVDSKEVQLGNVETPFLDSYENPIKEEVMFTKEILDNKTNGSLEAPIAIEYSKAKCEKEDKSKSIVLNEDRGEENPYEKVELNCSVILERKLGNFSKGDKMPDEKVKLISNKTKEDNKSKIKLPNEEQQIKSNSSATFEQKITRDEKKSKGFSNDDSESYGTKFAKTKGVEEVATLQNSYKELSSQYESSAGVDNSYVQVQEKEQDDIIKQTKMAKKTSDDLFSNKKINQEPNIYEIRVEDMKVDGTTKDFNLIRGCIEDSNISEIHHVNSSEKEKKILMQHNVMNEFRNLAYEREQERIHKLMLKKAETIGIKQGQPTLSSGHIKHSKPRKRNEEATQQKSSLKSSKEGTLESFFNVMTTLLRTSSELSQDKSVQSISGSTKKNYDHIVAQHIQDIIFKMAESKTEQCKKITQKAQEDKEEFQNSAYERVQRRIVKCHDNLKKPLATENRGHVDPVVLCRDSSSSESKLTTPILDPVIAYWLAIITSYHLLK